MDCDPGLRLLNIGQYILFLFIKSSAAASISSDFTSQSPLFRQDFFFFTYPKYMNKVVLFIV